MLLSNYIYLVHDQHYANLVWNDHQMLVLLHRR